MFEWDERKAAQNLAKHGVAFDAVERFDFEAVWEMADDRFDYGERRILAVAPLDGRLHALIYTRRGNAIRVISLRAASRRESRKYAEQIQT